MRKIKKDVLKSRKFYQDVTVPTWEGENTGRNDFLIVCSDSYDVFGFCSNSIAHAPV